MTARHAVPTLAAPMVSTLLVFMVGPVLALALRALSPLDGSAVDFVLQIVLEAALVLGIGHAASYATIAYAVPDCYSPGIGTSRARSHADLAPSRSR